MMGVYYGKFTKGKIDMTTGHIMRNIILFAIPIIIGNVLQAVIYYG